MIDAAPMTIADQLQRIQHHAESLDREAALKATVKMSGSRRHPYTASELLQMRGEKVIEYMREEKQRVTINQLSEDLGISYTMAKEVVAMLVEKKRIRVADQTPKGRKFYSVRSEG